MKLKSVLTSLMFVVLGAAAQAQLPDSFNGWETKSFRPIAAARLEEAAGNDAAMLREYGFVSGERREYARDTAGLNVILWKLRDSSGAFGLFTFYRDIGTATLEAPDRIAVWTDRLVVQHGPYLVDARGTKLTIGDGKLLLSKLPPLQREDATLPDLPDFLPEEKLVAQSGKFVLGPAAFQRLVAEIPPLAIGFDKGAEALIAQYRVDGKTVRLLLVSYPTPQFAAKQLRSFEQVPAIAERKAANQLFFDRKGSVVGFVLDAPSQSVAQVLFGGIRHESQVTWSEYVPTRRDNIGQLVVNVFLLAGFVLFFALVAGISYGGIRVLAKKFLPFPIFDRPSQMEIIRLHLSDE